MNLSFAEHILELRAWETKKEMTDFLAQCGAGELVLGEDAEQELEFYSVIAHLNYSATSHLASGGSGDNRFGVGICSQGHGLRPHLLLLPEKQLFILGFNAEAVCISTKDRDVRFRISFDYSPFRSFIYLYKIVVILAFHECGVVALTEGGQELWKYDKDVIIDSVIQGDWLHLSFMDSPSVNIHILSGSISID